MTMSYRPRLSHRIILSVVLLTVVVSGLFTLGLTATIHYVEESLLTDEMQEDFARVFEDYRRGRDLRLDEGAAFFPAGPNLPDYLRSIPPGYTEIVLDEGNRAYYAYRHVEDGISYFMVKDQTFFEKEEILLQRAVFSGFALSVVVSFVLGVSMVKQVIAPVRKLTRQVAEGAQNESRALAAGYPDDEIGALAGAFDETFARLQRALDREALFTSDVSHELRTPLMVIQSTCEVLAAGKELDDYTRQKIEAIRRAAKEMKELVEAFLALARRKEMHSETATLDAIVRSQLPKWEQMAGQKGNRLVLQEKTRDPAQKTMAYPAVLLRTVIDNLIQNAIHHTADGEIVLVLRAGGFEVRDNGTGIAVNDMYRVFQPYYRGTASHREGLGLGLSLVQRICEREEWRVTLEPNHPKGCRFQIDLG
jgi:signal transduction histidine kinase